MRVSSASTILVLLLTSFAQPANADCEKGTLATEDRLGVSRIVQIDTTAGALYGRVTKLENEPNFLKPKEVVLTFDDGPAPQITLPILEALERHCTRATFFPVGKMALAYPDIVRKIISDGHTVGSHTFSHPGNLARMPIGTATAEINSGFAAVAVAAGQRVAPLFRFPGLNDSNPLLSQLQKRGITTMSVDVISNDSFAPSADFLVKHTLKKVEERNGGIILFHDIKPQTATALPSILDELKKRGYSVVHIRSKYMYKPPKAEMAEAAKRLKTKRLQSSPVTKDEKKTQTVNNDSAAAAASKEPKTSSQVTTTGSIDHGNEAANETDAATGQDQPFRFLARPSAANAILAAIGPPTTELQPPPRKRVKSPAKKTVQPKPPKQPNLENKPKPKAKAKPKPTQKPPQQAQQTPKPAPKPTPSAQAKPKKKPSSSSWSLTTNTLLGIPDP